MGLKVNFSIVVHTLKLQIISPIGYSYTNIFYIIGKYEIFLVKKVMEIIAIKSKHKTIKLNICIIST